MAQLNKTDEKPKQPEQTVKSVNFRKYKKISQNKKEDINVLGQPKNQISEKGIGNGLYNPSNRSFLTKRGNSSNSKNFQTSITLPSMVKSDKNEA